MTKFALLAGAALMTFGGAAIAQVAATPSTASATPAPTDMSTPPATAPDASAQATTPDAPNATTTAPTATAQTEMTKPNDPSAPAAAPASATATNAATPAASGQVAANVQSDWSKYDKGNKGSLTPLEFGEWVMAAQGQDMTAKVNKTRSAKASNLPAVKVLNATATSFAKADTNHDKMISPEELSAFLAG